MTPRRRQRLIFVVVVLAGVGIATVLAVRAIGENMLYFFSPSQVLAGEAPGGQTIRIGGLVVDGSFVREANGLTVKFDVTDTAHSMPVDYTGILPDLFREGQGIVAMGKIGSDGVFHASEVLAKHDEKYMPPDVKDALAQAKAGGQMKSPHARSKL